MALAVASYSSNTATSSTTVVVTKPTGVAVGDLLLIIAGGSAGGSTPESITCPNFSSAYNPVYDSPGGFSDVSTKFLYKIADSSDVSASNYTISGEASNMGVVAMLRITGWVTGNPIYQSSFAGFNPSVSGTFTKSSISLTRVSQTLMIIVGASYDSSNSDYITSFTDYTVVSGESNPTWTEVVDAQTTTGGGGTGKKSMGVAYATSSNVTPVTSFSFGYTEVDADDSCGAMGTLIILNEPVSTTGTNALLSVSPAIFTNTAVSVGTDGTNATFVISPNFPSQSGDGAAATVWTPISKS